MWWSCSGVQKRLGLKVKTLQKTHLILDIYKQEVAASFRELANHPYNLIWWKNFSWWMQKSWYFIFTINYDYTSICCLWTYLIVEGDKEKFGREEGGHFKERNKPWKPTCVSAGALFSLLSKNVYLRYMSYMD